MIMKFVFLLVTFVVGYSLYAASDADRDSSPSPDVRIFRALSRSSLSVPSELASRTSFSDPGSEGVPIQGYFSLLDNANGSSSSSSSHSDSESDKCALSDRELLKIGQLYQIISNKLYGSADFQKNVYSALDLYQHPQIDFNPTEGKTLGDLLFCLFKHQQKIDDHIKEHILLLERFDQDGQQQRGSLQRIQDDVALLQDQISGQQELVENMCGIVKNLQQHIVDFQQEVKTLASLIAIMREGKVAKLADKECQE